MLTIKRLSTTQSDFWGSLRRLMDWDSGATGQVEQVVVEILEAVRRRGDSAVLEYTARFDRITASCVAELEISPERRATALDRLPSMQREALEFAAERIRAYHQRQKTESWSYTEPDGSILGQQVTPLERVGVYVPGGKAAYPSSVLMNVLPARVAGVDEITMLAPAPGGEINPLVLAAAQIARVDRLFTIGGAQAIGVLAYGSETIAAVDKIVGPGNAYVAEAKRRVFGQVGIDMIAGPSEIMVVCDGQTDPEWIAVDLFAQAEHDEDARAMLVCPDPLYLDQVQSAMERLLPAMERSEIIRAALNSRGALICVRDLAEAADVVNFVAPEHLELSLIEPERMLSAVRHAGAVFLGQNTAEVFGDYCAGPNHVLPTSRTARFASPLGVYDFQKRTSLVRCSGDGAARLGRIAGRLARGEGLTAHARSAEYRVQESDDEQQPPL